MLLMLSFLSAGMPEWFIQRVQIFGAAESQRESALSGKLISIEEATSRVLSEAAPLSVEYRSLDEALGMVLGQEIVANDDVPRFANSAMDGFAVRAVDVASATPTAPVRLQVVGTVAAGAVAAEPLGSGKAMMIMTGAPIPEGADAVVRSESAEIAGDEVLVREASRPGAHIRRRGEDMKAGDKVLEPGDVLGPAELGLLASLGFSKVKVHRRPRVAILATGSELVEIDRDPGPGQIRNSNTYSLQAQCRQLGVDPVMLGIVSDDREATTRAMEQGLQYDVLLTSGGVSVGRFDFVRDVQDELGVQRRLWGVSMKPGKPLVFGVRAGTLVFGLPGNPVSAMVSFELFVRPALLRLMGYRKTTRPLHRAVIAEDLANADGRVYVVRVRAWREDGVWRASSTGPQGSGILRSMVGANGLVFVPGGPRGVKAGEEVDLLLLREDLVEP
jgi:molybdopterin molybdotransferase